jgi:hypothetical protein
MMSSVRQWLRQLRRPPAPPPSVPEQQALEIVGPLLVARAQAELTGEEERGRALLDQLVIVGGIASLALTVGAAGVTLIGRHLPWEHVRVFATRVDVGTIGVVVLGAIGVVFLGIAISGLLSLAVQAQIAEPPRAAQEFIDGYQIQLDKPLRVVVRDQLVELGRRATEAARLNERRQAVLRVVILSLSVGAAAVVLVVAILLMGRERVTDVNVTKPSVLKVHTQ